MLDIELFRTNIDKIIESEKKRFKDPTNARKVLEFDEKLRDVLKKYEEVRQKLNKLNPEIGKLINSGEKEKAEALKQEVKDLKKEQDEFEQKKKEYKKLRDDYRYIVGNILHESVPIAETEEGNGIERTYGKKPQFNFTPLNHVKLIETTDGADTKKASEVVGSRFYYLKGDLVMLNLALLKFALEFLQNKGFLPMWTPFFIKHEVIKAAAELADFEEQLYKIHDEDLYMIATSEQTIAAFHYDEIIEPERLPMKYAGISSCFRREAGSHGKDTLGIFRIHQFEKIEQFIFSKPGESWEFHEELIANAEEIYKQLELPYRVVNIASGELNDNCAKKYDLEAWFPASETYRELVSCSNCLDYQGRKLKIRMGKVGTSEKKQIVHTLNATAIATERTICCILENYQNEDGSVSIPKVLQKYMNDKKIINALE